MNDVSDEPGPTPALWLERIERRYGRGDTTVEVLNGADLTLWPGQSVALIAPSGAGKSTLLHLAGLLERPSGGEVYIGGAPTSAMSDDKRTALRRVEIGFVYQFHHLLPEFSALENIVLPQMIRGLKRAEAAKRAHELLSYLGLAAREKHRPAELSGGEQQRVAIARALVTNPALILADEPTGALDSKTTVDLMEMFVRLNSQRGMTIVLVTHELEVAAYARRVVQMLDGRIIFDGPTEQIIPAHVAPKIGEVAPSAAREEAKA
jgi:lipoprotein-releasing system ATP-binding protein